MLKVNSGASAFFIACRLGHLDVAKVLAAAGADLRLGKDNGA